MEFRTQLDDAVSPVVAVILMVAVTVILSAVIGTFVLDLGNNVQANPQAGVTLDQSISSDTYDSDGDGVNDSTGYQVTVDVVSMDNADSVTAEYIDSGSAEEVWDDDDNSTTAAVDYKPSSSSIKTSSVGDSLTFDHLTPGDKVTVIGNLDGKEVVLQTHTVEE